MQMTAGTALGSTNTQEKGFQYGVKVSGATGKFTVSGGIMNFTAPLQLYGHPNTPNGELGFFIGDGTQSNYIKFVITKTGLLALQEINDLPSTPIKLDIPIANRPNAGLTFCLTWIPPMEIYLLIINLIMVPQPTWESLLHKGYTSSDSTSR